MNNPDFYDYRTRLVPAEVAYEIYSCWKLADKLENVWLHWCGGLDTQWIVPASNIECFITDGYAGVRIYE